MQNCANPLPLVSVIVPVYNHEKYVKQAVESVLEQTYPNIELIIIDDGSKDGSAQCVQDCINSWKKNKRSVQREITFIKQMNQGAHTTINSGLSKAKGRFLTILNSDDYFHLDRIETLVIQTARANAHIAFSYVIGIDEKNKKLPSKHWWPRWYEKSKSRLFRSHTVGFLLMQENLAVSTGNLFFTQELYKKIGEFKNLKLAHDLDFLIRALIETEPLLIRENHYYYRIHQMNTQHQVQHLMDAERKEIYRCYLTQVAAAPPKNNLAPCHWYWPVEFSRLRLNLKMDHAFTHYIQTPTQTQVLKKNDNSHNEVPDTKKKQKVCLVSHELSLSGAPKVVADLALYLKRKGYRPYVLALNDGPMRQELEKFGISVTAASGSLLKRCLQWMAFACFKTTSLTFVNSMVSWPFVSLMAIFHPFRNIKWYIHETAAPRSLDGRISFPLFKWFKKKQERQFWFGSKSTAEAWSIHNIEGNTFYWSGIPSQPLIQRETKQIKKLLFVGTASARKGTYHLVEAFISCLEKKLISEDTQLTIVGFPSFTSPDFPGLEDLLLRVISSKFRDNIQLIGSVPPDFLDQYYDATDLFIQPSTLECLPLSLLKAMSVGLPIITTDVNGCAEAIQDNYNGIICLPFHPQSLAEAIVKAVNNPETCAKLGMQAQISFNEKFSLEATADKVLKQLKLD